MDSQDRAVFGYLAFALFVFMAWASVVGGVIYLAIHFARKFW